MPITVDVPELGRSVEFPDDMSHEDIASAITQHLGSIAQAGFQQAVGVTQKAASMFGVGRGVQESMLRGEAKSELQRQQREAQVAGDIAASEAAGAGAGEQAAWFVSQFPNRVLKAPFELAQAFGVPIGKPTLNPEEIAYLRSKWSAMESPLTPPQPAGEKEQAITDWLNEQASAGTSPEMGAALGSPVVAAKLAKMSPEAIGSAGRLIARGFQAQMAAGVPEAVQQTVEAPDVPSAIKGGLSTAAAVGLPLAIEAGLRRPLPKIPDYPGLRLRSERGVPTALGNEELQAEAAKQAAILEYGRTAKVQDLRPAVKTMEGEVVAGEKGQSHNDIIEQNKIPATDVDKREFVDAKTGQELSRQEVATAIPTEKPGEAHSSDLAKAQEPSPERPPKNPYRTYFKEGENMNQFLARATDEELLNAERDGQAYASWLKEEQDYRKRTKDETWKDLNPIIADANHFASGANWERLRRSVEKQSQQPTPETPSTPPPPTPATEAAPSAAPPAVKAEPTKEPWQMRYADYSRQRMARGDYPSGLMEYPGASAKYFGDAHRGIVEYALKQGKPVPPEVLADYPDLKPSGTPPPPAQPKGETGGGVQRVEKLKPGYVRLWRGGTAGKEGLWFSDDKEVAKFHYENHQYDAPATLSYVDVPKADAAKYMDAAFSHPDVLSKKTIAESGDHVLPPEVAANAKVVRRTTKPTRPAFLQKLEEQSGVWRKNTRRALNEGYENASLEPITTVDVKTISPSDEHGYADPKLIQHIKDGKPIPPVVLEKYPDGTTHIVDGSNRVNASIKAGAKTIKAQFVKYADEPPTPPPAEQKPPPPADVGPGMVGMGGALTGEVETGHGADIYGIAERVRAERAKAGQVAPVEPGEGISAQESVEHGRELLDAGANAEQVLSNFEKTKQLSSEDMAVARAHGELLAFEARRIEEKFGTTSQQYLDAWKRLSDWDARSKAMQTEWHKTGQAQQGETDIDTGTFTGLQRAHKEATGKDFTPQQAKKAKDVADRSAKATAEADKAKADLNTEMTKEPPVTPRVKALSERLISILDKSAETALARIKKRRAEGRLFTGIPVEDMADYAIYGASKISKGLVEFGKWSEEMVKDIGDFIKPHLKDIWEAADKRLDFEIKRLAPGPTGQLVKESVTTGTGGMSAAERRAFNAEKKTVRENAIRIANLENKARRAEVERDNAIAAIEAASKARGERTGIKQTREEAIRTAKGASKARLDKAERDKATADAQLKAARDAQSQSQARAREYAAKVAQTERRLQGNPMKRVWNRANIYLEKGLDNFDEIRNKVATDLGMTVNQVTRLMAQSPRIKQLANDLWRKQQNARRLKEQAKRWVWSLSTPGYLRALQMVPRAMFGLKVGFHGTVALGTHAPMVAFQPRFWATYVRDFGKMYGMVGSKAYYERQVQDLLRRPNYITARRAGLVNDPFVYEDYNSPDTAKYFGGLTGMGNRGYTVLKIIRQDMFDQMWEKLPKTAQIPEVAQAIADGLNHATGVVKGRAPRGTNVALFAPRLEASRVMWLLADPAKMVGTFINWKNASTGDRMFAMNQLKEKAWVFGTLAGMLALNQGFLTATGSKQKINGVPKALGGSGIDPMESDFLKFKAAGLDVAYGSAMLNMAKLPMRMATSIMFHGKTSKLILEDERVYKIAGDYIRSQLSPFAGTATDLALGRDYMGRPLPRALFGTIEGPKDIPKRLRLHGVTKPYTWPEYSSIQFTPIPISEGIHEVWGQGLGMSDAQIDHYMKAWAIISIMAGTGARVTEDYQLKK